MNALILLSNVFLLLLWMRLWRVGPHEFTFNPLLSGPSRLADAVIDFLRPVLIGLPSAWIAGLSLLFLLAFRGVLLCSAGADWQIVVGMGFGRVLGVGNWFDCTVFSITVFVVFLIRIWGLGFLIAVMTPARRPDRVAEAFAHFTRPFSLLPRLHMGLALVALNALLVIHLQHVGRPFTGSFTNGLTALPAALDWQQPVAAVVRLSWLTALSLADSLHTAGGAMMGVVLASLLATITQNHGLQQLTRESVAFLLGGFSRRPVVIGLIDLTPLAYFFAMNILYGLATGLLRMLLAWSPAP